jgi:hypothetical protein
MDLFVMSALLWNAEGYLLGCVPQRPAAAPWVETSAIVPTSGFEVAIGAPWHINQVVDVAALSA